MPRLLLSEDADRDLDDIYIQSVDLFGVRQADQYIDGLLDTLDMIVAFPRMARLRDDISPPVRAHAHQSHVIIYDVDDHGDVLIVRIRHAHEDWQQLSEGTDQP